MVLVLVVVRVRWRPHLQTSSEAAATLRAAHHERLSALEMMGSMVRLDESRSGTATAASEGDNVIMEQHAGVA